MILIFLMFVSWWFMMIMIWGVVLQNHEGELMIRKRICSQIPKMLLKINFWWFGLIRNRNRDIFRNLKIASERQFFNHILFILDSCPCKSLSFSIKPLAISLHFLSFSIDFRLIFWFPFIFVSRTSPFNFQGLGKNKKNGWDKIRIFRIWGSRFLYVGFLYVGGGCTLIDLGPPIY